MAQSPIEEFFGLQKELEKFTQSINGVITDKRKQIINDKQQHHLRLIELKSNESKLNQQIDSLIDRRQQLEGTITHSIQDLQQQQAKVEELNEKQAALNHTKSQLDQQVKDLQEKIEQYRKDIEVSNSNLHKQNTQDDEEVMKFERYLGLKIEVKQSDLIRFIFINIDPNNIDKEFWVDIDLSNNDFKISDTNPALNSEELSKILSEFNGNQEFGRFLKLIRNLFKSCI